MKTTLMAMALCLAGSGAAWGQEALWSGGQTASPMVNNDGSVTFSVIAPKAVRVEVTGDFLPPQPAGRYMMPGTAELQEGKDGLWTYTTPPLAPELYSYTLRIDGRPALDEQNVYVTRDVAQLSNIFIVTAAEGDRGSLYSVGDVPHGNVSRVWYDSPQLGMQRRMTVYTPAGYDRGRGYPVLYLLHGAGGDEEAWTTLGRAAQIMDNLIAAGKARPMVVVMPNGNTDCQAAPGEWSRGMYRPSFQASLGQKARATMDESFMDIVSYVESHYKVARGRMHRAICGLSMGGYHSFATSKRFPDAFGYVGLFSAAIHLQGGDGQTTYDRLQADAEVQAQLRRLFAASPALYWIGIGRDDFLYAQNADLRRYLDEQGYRYEYVETDGGHIWRNWRIYLTTFVQKLFR